LAGTAGNSSCLFSPGLISTVDRPSGSPSLSAYSPETPNEASFPLGRCLSAPLPPYAGSPSLERNHTKHLHLLFNLCVFNLETAQNSEII
jgi:hypothetical protein